MLRVCVVGAERGVSELQTTHPRYVRPASRRSRAEEEARIRSRANLMNDTDYQHRALLCGSAAPLRSKSHLQNPFL